MTLYEKINPNDIFYESKGNTPLSLEELILEDNGKIISIMGPSKKGKAFYPQGFNAYSGSNGQTFSEVVGEIYDHYKDYQGRINSIYASYVSLLAGSQLNYTRLLGINHDIFSNENKPGFEIGSSGSMTEKLYVLGAEFNKKNNEDLTRFNYNFLENNNLLVTGSNNDIYNLKIGFLVTKKGVTFNTGSNYNKYELYPDDYDYTYKNLYSLKLENFEGTEHVIPQNNDLVLDVINITNKTPKKIHFNFNKNSEYYFAKVFNTNPLRLNEFGYVLYLHEDIEDLFSYCIENDETNSNNNLKYYLEDPDETSGGFSGPGDITYFKDFKKPYSNSKSPWFVSQGFYGNNENSNRKNLRNRIIKLFRIHSLSEGASGNELFLKVVPQSLGNHDQWASFDLHVFSKNSNNNNPVESFINLNLNENSENYILRRIGDFQNYFDFAGSERIVNKGLYNLNSKYIYVEVSKEVEYQNIPKETIPSGFIESKKYNNFGNLNFQSANNYVNSMIFKSENIDSKISDYHSWGHNLFNVCENKEFANYVLKNKTIITGSNFSNLFIPNDLDFKVIKINNENIYKEKIERYLTPMYYYESDLNNNLNDTEIFHLEKIVLFNSKKDNILRQHWELSTYDTKGELLQNLNNNTQYYNEFLTNSINQNNNPFYYYQISNEKNFINENKLIDSVEILGNNRHYISFIANMSGGFDGLDMFDIEQISMTYKGMQNNPYIKELYKYGLDVMVNNTNSEFIHLAGIYENEIIEKINSNIEINDYRRKPIYVLDKPLYDSNNQIVESHELLIRKVETNGINPKWSDHVYQYNQEKDVDIQKSLIKWNLNNIKSSYISSFANYFKVNILNGGNLKFDNEKEYDIILPSSILAMFILLNNNLNSSITDLDTGISKIQDNNIEQLIGIFKENDPKFEFNKKNIINNIVNTILSSGTSSNLKYYTSKTNAYIDTSNNQSLNSVLLIRIILNQIKRLIESAGNRLVFENVRSRKETLIRHNNIYTNIMNRLVDSGTILDYTIKLDEYSTTEEDMMNNIVRGEIFIVFNGQSNFIKNSQNLAYSIKI